MRYREFMLKASRLDRLIQEQSQYRQIQNDLTNGWLNYATHKETGVIYDVTVIKEKLETISKEIKQLEEELDDG